MEKQKSQIPFDYIVIKTTKGRIDKGLLAIPVSLIEIFPKQKGSIFIETEKGKMERKIYTPYESSSRECRIGGLKDFYKKYLIQDGDEVVIQKKDDNKFRLLPEKAFKNQMASILSNYQHSLNEIEADKNLEKAAQLSNLEQDNILRNVFIGMSASEVMHRKIKKNILNRRESVPLSMRKILLSIYNGKCQVSGFSFLMKNGLPYFEIHHIDNTKGNHPKNLLVVSPNIHAQFTYSEKEQEFDSDGWLRLVKFNNDSFKVFQIIDKFQKEFIKEIHF